MKQEVKIIKRMIIYMILTFLVAFLANLNSENNFLSINSTILSNNFVLTIAGGICTGITAVLLEKIYKYHIDKVTMIQNMYVDAYMLYGEIYFWVCNIKELKQNREVQIPKNLFSNKQAYVYSYISRLINYGYCSFWMKNSLCSVFDSFQVDGFNYINKVLSLMGYLEISINESEIIKLKTGIDDKENVYKVLTIFEKKLLHCEQIIDSLLVELSKNSKNLDWEYHKNIIVNKNINIYGQSVEEFIKNNTEDE